MIIRQLIITLLVGCFFYIPAIMAAIFGVLFLVVGRDHEN